MLGMKPRRKRTSSKRVWSVSGAERLWLFGPREVISCKRSTWRGRQGKEDRTKAIFRYNEKSLRGFE